MHSRHMFEKAHLKRTADALVAGHLGASRNIENLGLLVAQLACGSGFGNRVNSALM